MSSLCSPQLTGFLYLVRRREQLGCVRTRRRKAEVAGIQIAKDPFLRHRGNARWGFHRVSFFFVAQKHNHGAVVFDLLRLNAVLNDTPVLVRTVWPTKLAKTVDIRHWIPPQMD